MTKRVGRKVAITAVLADGETGIEAVPATTEKKHSFPYNSYSMAEMLKKVLCLVHIFSK
jgi:hypothetical protein